MYIETFVNFIKPSREDGTDCILLVYVTPINQMMMKE
jgi:hypothetical protein